MKLTTRATLVALISIFVLCDGEFYIATSPKSMQFISGDGQAVRRRELTGIINFLMGLPSSHLHRTESWPGMKDIDVFSPPKANLLITLHLPEGKKFALEKYVIMYATDEVHSRISPVHNLNSALVSDFENDGVVQTFVLSNKFPQGELLDSADPQKIRDRLNREDSILDAILSEGTVLDHNLDSDLHIFGDLQMMSDALGEMGPAKSDRKQSISIALTSLGQLAQEYGPMSPQVQDAISLFERYIPKFIEDATSKFDGQLLCEVDVTNGPPIASDYLVRHTRSLQGIEADATTNFTKLNLATPNSADYAVIFNITLWLMIGFFVAALAATYSMWDMDPGKDNIIYRVTSQRMKSD